MRKPDSLSIAAKAIPVVLLLIGLSFISNSVSRAQQSVSRPVTVSGVSSYFNGSVTLVQIAADSPLNRVQTWQDHEGYHVVVPSAGPHNAIKVGSGIKLRELDRTLEILILTKPRANVTGQSQGNRLILTVDGKLESGSADSDVATKSPNPDDDSQVQVASKDLSASQGMPLSASTQSAVATQTSAQTQGSNPVIGADAPKAQEPDLAAGESSVMAGTTAILVLALGCVGLLVLRRRRSTQSAVAGLREEDYFDEPNSPNDIRPEANRSVNNKPPQEGLMKANGVNGSNGTPSQRKSLARVTVAMPASLYGAYQVDQEIGKLVLGQPHKMDVVASRAPDDRRAIEASLLKTLIGAGADDDIRRRARAALEEYGFVARQSATMLMAADPYERTSAARMLGDVKSSSALPFLLEALYDNESLVRNQAVVSIGELKLPAAIGALLDIARKHPDVPGSLLSKALSACSVEGLDFFDSPMTEPRQLSAVDARVLASEITRLEPASAVEELPETSDDEKFVRALAQIESSDLGERSEAIKVLGQFPVQTSVTALARVARIDSETSLRALAISSLAFINHESVFPAILIAMADESRGVRAASARSLSRLSFDRSDAYKRVTETDDAETLRDVAQACIKAGIAGQGIDRLASGDHQAYEALSVVSLLVKANEVGPLLDAIANHPSMDVRLTVVHVLGMVGDPALVGEMRQLAVDCNSDVLRDAMFETICKLETPLAAEDHEDEDVGGELATESISASEYETTQPQTQRDDAEAPLEFEATQHEAESSDESLSDSDLHEAESPGLQVAPIA
jgi:HEAT repeat protein